VKKLEEAKEAIKQAFKKIGKQVAKRLVPIIAIVTIALILIVVIIYYMKLMDSTVNQKSAHAVAQTTSASGVKGISSNPVETLDNVVNGWYKDDDDETSSGSSDDTTVLMEYIHLMEGAQYNADGTKYVVCDDGAGNPTVGYGVDIFNGGHADEFIQAGYGTNFGAEVDIEFVDNIEKREMQACYDSIEKILTDEGITLKSYQLNAMVSRAYNCGISGALGLGNYKKNGLTFAEAYKEYWKDSDDKFGEAEPDFNHPLYTNHMSLPNSSRVGYMLGLERRRQSEWRLFQTGHYLWEEFDEWHSDSQSSSGNRNTSGTTFLDIADEIHEYMEQHNYGYCVIDPTKHDTDHGGIGGPCGLDATFEDSKTGHPLTCCATFVSWSLVEFGYTEFADKHGCCNLDPMLRNLGAEEITDYNALQPGDICFKGDSHVQIYAGNGTWFNAGANEYIRCDSPYEGGMEFTHALRLDALSGTAKGKKKAKVDKYADKSYAEKMNIVKVIDKDTVTKAHEAVLGKDYTKEQVKNMTKAQKEQLVEVVNTYILNSVLTKYKYTEAEISGWDNKKKSQYIELLEWGYSKAEIDQMNEQDFKNNLKINGGSDLYISTRIVWKSNDVYHYYLKTVTQLEKLICAELITQYPKMDPEKIEGLNGIVKFMRVGRTSGSKELKHLEYDEFRAKVSNGDADVLNYFAVDKRGNVSVATWKNINRQTGGMYPDGADNSNAPATSTEYSISTTSVNYKSMVEAYTMPFNYLWTFLVETEDVDFVMELADLVYDSDIQISLYDKVTTTTETTTRTTHEAIDISADIVLESKDSTTYSGQRQTDYSQVSVVETTTNTIEQHLTYANVWAAIYTHNYRYSISNNTSENVVPYGDTGPRVEEFGGSVAPIEARNAAQAFANQKDSEVSSITGTESIMWTETKDTVVTEVSTETIQEVAAQKAVFKDGTAQTFASITGNISDLSNMLFIGDSYFEGLQGYGIIPGARYSAEIGVWPRHWISHFDELPTDVNTACVYLGLNGMGYANQIGDMETLIDMLSTRYTTIYVIGVMHVGAGYQDGVDNADSFNAKIDEFNRAIESKCKTISNVKYIETSEGLVQGGYLTNVEPDNLHLTVSGSKIWAQNIANAIASINGATGINSHWPAPDSTTITSGFGPRNLNIAGASTYHNGIDIGASLGTEAQAAESGVVVESVAWSGSNEGQGARGNFVTIDHGNGYKTRYQHLRDPSTLTVGQTVTRGQVVGYVGSTGVGSGPHLHFEVLENDTPINPLLFKYDNGMGEGTRGVGTNTQTTTTTRVVKKKKVTEVSSNQPNNTKLATKAETTSENQETTNDNSNGANSTSNATTERSDINNLLRIFNDLKGKSERLLEAARSMTYVFKDSEHQINTSIKATYNIDLTEKQEAVIQRVYSMEEFDIIPGFGQMWAEHVILGGTIYIKADGTTYVASSPEGDDDVRYHSAAEAADGAQAAEKLYTDIDNIPVAACVYGTVTEASPYGRVGIYLGEAEKGGHGLVAWATEGYVIIDTLDNFFTNYGYNCEFRGWAWLDYDNDLSLGNKNKVTIVINEENRINTGNTGNTNNPGDNTGNTGNTGNTDKPGDTGDTSPEIQEEDEEEEYEEYEEVVQTRVEKEPSFSKLLDKHLKARKAVNEISSWILEALSKNKDTANMVDLTIYILNQASNSNKYGDVEWKDVESMFYPDGKLTDVGAGDYNVKTDTAEGKKIKPTKEQLRKAFEGSPFSEALLGDLDKIYEVQEKYNINGIFTAAVEIKECGAGTNKSGRYGKGLTSRFSVENGHSFKGFDQSSRDEETEDFAKLISSGSRYFAGGNYTVSKIGVSYCNADWIKDVQAIMVDLFNSAGIKVSTTGGNGDFLQVAESVWKEICTSGNFPYYAVPNTIPCTGPSVNCSSFVSWVLYKYGYTEFAGNQHYTQDFYLTNWTAKYGWQEFNLAGGENPIDILQPGDLIVRDPGDNNGHITLVVSIENGRILCYDCGSKNNWIGNSGTPVDKSYMLTDGRTGKVIRVTQPK